MADVTVRISGLDELERKLKELPKQFAKKAVRKALKAGAEPIVTEMETLAPKRTGFLSQHIGTKIKLTPKETAGTIRIGPSSNAFYAMFLEFGTSKMSAQPFMRKAFENQKQRALQSFTTTLKDVLVSLFQ